MAEYQCIFYQTHCLPEKTEEGTNFASFIFGSLRQSSKISRAFTCRRCIHTYSVSEATATKVIDELVANVDLRQLQYFK